LEKSKGLGGGGINLFLILRNSHLLHIKLDWGVVCIIGILEKRMHASIFSLFRKKMFSRFLLGEGFELGVGVGR